MTSVDAVAEAIYREHWGGEPKFKQDRFNTLHPDDQDEYRRMAQAAIEALGLTEEWTWSWNNGSARGVPGYGFSVTTRAEAAEEGPGMNIVSRLVSAWVRTDQ